MEVDNVAGSSASSTSTSSSSNPGLGILVFVHGFKGDDKTFLDYPERLRHSLSSTFGPATDIHALIYPAFETRGELSQCVEQFGSWLTTKVAELEMERAGKNEDGHKDIAKVVLIGHSMGGIVVADCARSVARNYTQAGEKGRMWPKIVGIMAYDTPYLGVHPWVFKNGATEAWGYVQQAQTVAASVGAGWAYFNTGSTSAPSKGNGNSVKGKAPAAAPSSSGKGKARAADQDSKAGRSDGGGGGDLTKTLSEAGKAASSAAAKSSGPWGKYAYAAAGATALAAAAGTAWYSRQQIATTATTSTTWLTSHLEFVGVLWKPELLRERLEEIVEMADDNHIQFHCFYTLLKDDGRTFCILPNESTLPNAFIQARPHYTSNLDNRAKNEVEAHCAMFDIKTNDGVFVLGQQSALMIARWMRLDGRKG